MAKRRDARAWYADWFAGRELMVLTPDQIQDAKCYFRFTPICAYPKGVEVLKGEVGFLPVQGLRVVRHERVH